MLDPQTILNHVQSVAVAARTVCHAIDRAHGFEHEEQQGLANLRQGVGSIKSDMMVYKVLITSMKNDTKPTGPSTFTLLINKYVWTTPLALLYIYSQQTICNITDRTDRMQ